MKRLAFLLPALPYLLGAALVAGVVFAGHLAWQDWRARRAGDAATAAVPVVEHEQRREAAVYTTDTVRLRKALVVVDTTHRALVLTDTVRVRAALAADSAAILACTTALSTCERRVALADSLAALRLTQLRAAERAAAGPRFERYVAGAYDVRDKVPVVRAGATLRLAGRLSLLAEGEQRVTPHDSPRALVGARLTF